MTIQNLEKKKLVLIAIIVFLVGAAAIYFISRFKPEGFFVVPPKEKTMEEILKDLTAPSPGREISEEVLESLTAPNQGRQVSEEVIKSLTAPK